jgi:hypothetical protein
VAILISQPSGLSLRDGSSLLSRQLCREEEQVLVDADVCCWLDRRGDVEHALGGNWSHSDQVSGFRPVGKADVALAVLDHRHRLLEEVRFDENFKPLWIRPEFLEEVFVRRRVPARQTADPLRSFRGTGCDQGIDLGEVVECTWAKPRQQEVFEVAEVLDKVRSGHRP